MPEPGNPQALNRYSYVYNNPLKYVDSSGHVPVVPLLIVGGIILLKAIDYGWTAWDAYQSTQVLADPHAGAADKAAAMANLALTVATEAAEPDDLLPVSLPLDDLARAGIIGGLKKASQEATEHVTKETIAKGAEKVARGGTYKLIDPVTAEVRYVGRTSNLTRRKAEHALDPIRGQLKFEEDWRVDDYAVQRGREQMLYDQHQPSLNRIRPINPRNPRRQIYLDAARHFEEKMQ